MARQMKDSGIEWIGEIPEEWEAVPLKRLATIQTGNTPSKSDGGDYFSQDDGCLWIKAEDLGFNRSISRTTEYLTPEGVAQGRVFNPCTIYVCCIASVGKVGYCEQEASCNQQINGLTFVNAHWKYGFYLSLAQESEYLLNASGNVMKILNSDKQSRLMCPLPPLAEQQRIAAFLDRKCAEIDAVIERTKATIEEYKKLKQAVITEAVTKGVRGPRPMKDSGIEWIAEIVDSWDMSRIGLHYGIVLGKMLCDKQLTEEYTLEPYFCAANIHFDGVSQEQLKQMWFSPAEKVSYRVQDGDLLVVEGGAGAGGAAVVTALAQSTYIQNSVMIVRGLAGQTNRYLRYWIECLVKKGYVDVVCNKATIPHFTKDKLATMPVPVIPVDEMEEIADYLDEKCAALDTLIAKKTALLTELETYKKSLIYEYVTGKKEVL